MTEDPARKYWEKRCGYCEALLRRDGGCSMWHGEPHDLPYGERQGAEPELDEEARRKQAAVIRLRSAALENVDLRDVLILLGY